MIRKRSFGTVAALGGLTAAIALLTGLPSAARADEVSDLRANQELLQRRIDQLAQGLKVEGGVYPYGPPAAVAGQPSIAGSFPRSFLIPGTDTSIKVYGEAREILDYFIDGGNPNASPHNSTVGDNGQLLSIPLHGTAARSRGTSIFWQTPQESKLGVETRTPTAFGEARTVIEFDFDSGNTFVPGGSGPTDVSDSIKPRLRFAYGTLGGFLAGQANSNFSDPDGNAETLDFGGNVGEAGVVRIPQVRYTMPLAPWGWLGALSFSAEDPETNGATAFGQISTDAGAVTGIAVTTTAAVAAATGVASFSPVISSPIFNPFKDPAPDLTMAWYIPQPWGHFDMSGVLRPTAEIKDGVGVDRTYTGWGVHAGFDVKPGWFGWSKDDILMQATGGIGIGRYLNSASTVEIQTNYPVGSTAGFDPKLDVHVVPAWGGEIGYQHWWAPNWRSDLNFGYWHQDLRSTMFAGIGAPGSLISYGGFNKELMNAHVNLIWNPVSFVTVGIEYTWGHRVTVANGKGDMDVIISKFGVSF